MAVLAEEIHARNVRPTGVERTFTPDEVIVTKTDPAGRITYANEVFCRLSALTEDQVIGQPHNLIRHPDMPRGVFRLLWQRLQAREELFAYVMNLAADGAHYWVFAHVTPTLDRSGRVIGYHSNRRTPDRQAVAAIQPVYRSMLAQESRAGRATEAAAAGYAHLEATVAGMGLSYDEYVWSLTAEAAS
jgi:PAS domain S-box-containing protein